MSVMRNVLLAMSTSPFLREQATRRAFVRKSVSAFMPGEKIEDALGAAAALKPQRINTILTRLGEGVTKLDEAERVTQHYLDVLDKVEAAGQRAGLDRHGELALRRSHAEAVSQEQGALQRSRHRDPGVSLPHGRRHR